MGDKIFKTVEEAVEYLFSSEIEAEMVALPPDPDELTDEEQFDDEDIGCPAPKDVPGRIEIQEKQPSPGNNDITPDDDVHEIELEEEEEEVRPSPSHMDKKNKNDSDNLRSSSTKRQKLDKLPSWEKTNPTYSFESYGGSVQKNVENLITSLQALEPVQLFEHFFDSAMFDFIKYESEKYAHEIKNKPNFKLTVDEIKTFIGFLIFSGYHTLPSERDYWSEDEDLGISLVKNSLSRNKFIEIKKMLHFANNTEASNNKNDRGFKVRKLITNSNSNFQKFGIFDECLSVDEMMVRYYGRHGIKQFLRGKPIRFGYKLWALCGSGGYCYNFDLYCGKSDDGNKEPLGSRVVKQMLSPVADPNSHAVFFDNFFTSHGLLCELKELGFRATGTLRQNRISKCPLENDKLFTKKEKGAYQFVFDSNNEITIVKWKDNACVTIATNYDFVEPHLLVSRRAKGGQSNKIKQPLVVSKYNQHMGGVDHHDWLLEKHKIEIRGKKWYWPIFVRVLEMAIVNSFIIYNKVNEEKLPIKEIRRSIALTYLKLGINQRKSVGRPLAVQTSRKKIPDSIRLDGKGHIIEKREKQRRCQYQNCTGKPLTFCNKCDVTLCTPCFPKFHQ